MEEKRPRTQWRGRGASRTNRKRWNVRITLLPGRVFCGLSESDPRRLEILIWRQPPTWRLSFRSRSRWFQIRCQMSEMIYSECRSFHEG
jgi:hypothetical protein